MKRLAVIAAPALLLTLTACGGGGDKPKPVDVKGTVTIDGSVYGDSADISDLDSKTDNGMPTFNDGDRCTGMGGYSDLTPGAQVTVTDDAGKTMGLGSLGEGKLTPSDHNCEFTFEVKDVEASAKFYKVKVTHREGPQYTLDDLKKGPSLTIGN